MLNPDHDSFFTLVKIFIIATFLLTFIGIGVIIAVGYKAIGVALERVHHDGLKGIVGQIWNGDSK